MGTVASSSATVDVVADAIRAASGTSARVRTPVPPWCGAYSSNTRPVGVVISAPPAVSSTSKA